MDAMIVIFLIGVFIFALGKVLEWDSRMARGIEEDKRIKRDEQIRRDEEAKNRYGGV